MFVNYTIIHLPKRIGIMYTYDDISDLLRHMKTGRNNGNIAGYAGRTTETPSAFIGTDREGMTGFDSAFAQALTKEAVHRNWQLIELQFFDGNPPEGVNLDGVFTRSIPGTERVKQLRSFTGNLIRIGSAPHPEDHVLPAVLPDLVAQGRLAANHFAERGFFHLGFVGRRPWSINEDLYIGVQKGVEERGMEVELLSLPAIPTHGRSGTTIAFEMFTEWIQRVPKPLGLVCPSDGFAARFCAWARSAGIRVPTDVAMLGNGDNPAVCERSLPRISSIGTSEYERGVAACELMADLLAGKKAPQKAVMIPPSGITVRESTDVLAAVDPVVANALLYMWPNIATDLSVDDISEHVGIHRRKLERAFRAELGRGVNAELLRRRLETSGDLLSDTDLTVTDIALLAGFRSQDYFYRAFRRAFGSTPTQWRKKHQ